MNQLQIFSNPEFGQVRMIEVDGEPYFVGKEELKMKNVDMQVEGNQVIDGTDCRIGLNVYKKI